MATPTATEVTQQLLSVSVLIISQIGNNPFEDQNLPQTTLGAALF